MGINFFEAIFNDKILNMEGDTQVCCPFPHKAGNTEYYETNPSAGVNLVKNVFHCFSCGASYSETSFAAKILNTTYEEAARYVQILHKAEHLDTWKTQEKNLDINDSAQEILRKLCIPNKTAKELHLGYSGGGAGEIVIPIVMFDHIIDKVTYRPGKVPKYLRKQKSMSGIICPFDLWVESPKEKPTLVCAGEKDMMIARAKGFNAISFTGGENNTPKMLLNQFEDRPVFIIYDNDEAGRTGAIKLALALKKHAKNVYIVDLSSVCVEKGEDLWDFFCKYNKTKKDLIQIMMDTREFTEEEAVRLKKQIYPTITLNEAIKPQNLNKVLKSNIQIIATIDATYVAPTLITATKVKVHEGEESTLKQGDSRSWCLNETNYKELFYMIDSNLKEKAIEKYIKTNLLYLPEKEKGIEIVKETKTPVFKCVVTDTVNSYSSNKSLEFIAYSLGNKLENGKKYVATYKLIPHPQDGQKIIMVIKDVEESDDFLTSFKINDEIITSLKKFQIGEKQTVEQKMNELIEKAKGIVNADYNTTLLKVIDIWFHSVLQFSVGRLKDIRGYIDTLLVGESRIGKSSTVAALQKMYNVGNIISLAGSSATVAGIIGGSDKVAGGAYQTRAGAIPQNNRGAIIFEELGKCRADILKELTDIRSSNKVRITRVNGSIELPAFVRMLSLSNPRTHDNIPKPIASYPNGIAILTDLIGTPEDIARYDMIAIFGFEADKEINPFYEPPEPLPQNDYQNRIRWVWSRTQEQVYISQTVYQYTIKQANDLNKKYGTFINIFGVEAWQKIIRIGIAIAGYVCSTDETFEQIIVTEEHIDEAIKLLLELYDNKTFKLREYVEEERSCNTYTNEDLDLMEELWKISSLLLDYLYRNPETTKSNLQMVCGLNQDEFNRLIYKLAKNNLIRIDKSYIYTTNKYNLCFNKIDRSVVIKREVVFKIED